MGFEPFFPPQLLFVLFFSFWRSVNAAAAAVACVNRSQFREKRNRPWSRSSGERRERGCLHLLSFVRDAKLRRSMPGPMRPLRPARKRQSSWKTRARSEPTRCSCQAEQLWPASASASPPFTRRHTADLRGKDATIRGALVHPGRAVGQTPCGWEWEVWGCYSKNSQQPAIVF